MTRVPLFVAFRYLFARKSHNVINIISAISAVGMTVGTAALILILSIYNGLDSVVRAGMDRTRPDLLVEPSSGKTFGMADSLSRSMASLHGVASVEPVLEETVFIDYGGSQSIARLKGVRSGYFEAVPLEDNLVEGSLDLKKGSLYLGVIGRGLASSLGISPRFVAGIDAYYPKTDRDISLTDPMSSLNTVRFFPSGTVAVNSSFDERCIIVPYGAAVSLLGLSYDDCSSLEIRFDPSVSGDFDGRGYRRLLSEVRSGVSEIMGPGFDVKDRRQQDETLYRMLSAEKIMIFLILFFVIVVIAFNIFGSLSMLIMEKSDDIGTFSAMGASQAVVKRIFIYEGWLISLLGLVSGLVAGVCLALLQQHFGLIKMPGNYMVTAYPCVLEVQDVLISAVSIAIVGYVVAALPVKRFFHRATFRNPSASI